MAGTTRSVWSYVPVNEAGWIKIVSRICFLSSREKVAIVTTLIQLSLKVPWDSWWWMLSWFPLLVETVRKMLIHSFWLLKRTLGCLQVTVHHLFPLILWILLSQPLCSLFLLSCPCQLWIYRYLWRSQTFWCTLEGTFLENSKAKSVLGVVAMQTSIDPGNRVHTFLSNKNYGDTRGGWLPLVQVCMASCKIWRRNTGVSWNQ